ncbi:MAG: DEAD/DEAH box helicase, partial [Candidatus Korarchaeota archaeon]|nr:DEAD/DEAH box helicase [Candidatus Korarchaeota archaeon]
FDRQAPHHEGLSADYYVRFCDFVRELRKCLSRCIGPDVDNLDVYLFMRYVEEHEGEVAEEQLIPVGSTEEILQKLGLNYRKSVTEGESPELSEVTFREKFPWLERSGARGRSLFGLKMYRHQLEVDEALSSGKNVILISGTGSGKTESWVLHALHEGKRALAVYPTLALSGDQEQRIRDYFEAVGSEKVFKLDAKVVRDYSKKKDRRLLRKRINLSKLIITNPAFLMSDLKRMAVSEGYLEKFLQDADIIVIDELDYYGSSGASLLIGGMLSLLYRHFLTAKKPQIVILTATLGNPEEVRDALTALNGRDTSIIEGRPFRLRNTTYLLLDREAEVKLPILLSSIVMSDESGVTLVFTRSINEAEQLVRRVQANLPANMQELVRAHHHLVSKEERRKIEESARGGGIRLITTPKTLIQGIDIGTVRRVVHYGLPMDVREFRQREGRKGRRRELGSSETIILPIRKWDHKLMEGGPEFLLKWASLPPEKIIVNPENKYVKLFESLYKVKSPFLASRVEEDEWKLLKDLGLIERVEVAGMAFDDLTEEALNRVWKYLNFYGYGPPYGYRRYHLRSGELLSEEEVSLPDVVEKFQPGCIDYSTSMIVVRCLKKGRILEDDLISLENSRTDIGQAIAHFKAEYRRIKEIWGEKSDFYGDFRYGRIFSRVDLLVRPPQESFGLLREIPLSVKWVMEGEGTKPVEFDGIVRERFLSRTVSLPVKTAGTYSLYTYGRAFPLDPLDHGMDLRLGMAYLIALLRLELRLSLNLIRYALIGSYTASQLVVWEPNPVGVLEMPHLWRSLRRAVERHKPDHLTRIYMWAVDREVVDLRLEEVGWEEVKRLALRALDYIESSFMEMPLLVDLSAVEPSRDMKVASFDLIDLSPLISREKALAVVFDGEEYRHFEMPRLESLKGEELTEDDLTALYSFFEALDSLVDNGFRLVHFSRGEEFARICHILGTFTKIKCRSWRDAHRVVDLHEKLVEKLGIDIIPIERVERVIGGFPGREVSFDDLVEVYASREDDNGDTSLIEKYAEENARSIYLLYLALVGSESS